MLSNQNDVFLLGVFDMFHEGHLALIKKASKLGKLTVGIVRDFAVQKQKGNNRPIQKIAFRADLIKSLKYVDDIILLDDFEIPNKILEDFDIICIGEDQKHIKNLDLIPFEKLYNLPRLPGVSTSDILKKLG